MTKLAMPAQNIAIQLPTGIEPLWYQKLLEIDSRVTTLENALAAFISAGAYSEGTYTPVLSAPSGTMPTFLDVPLTGRYYKIGRVCINRIAASNSAGGVAGAGSGQLSVTLPIPVRATAIGGRVNASMFSNAGSENIAFIAAAGGSSTGLLYKLTNSANQAPMTGADFNNVNRAIQFQFYYPTD